MVIRSWIGDLPSYQVTLKRITKLWVVKEWYDKKPKMGHNGNDSYRGELIGFVTLAEQISSKPTATFESTTTSGTGSQSGGDSSNTSNTQMPSEQVTTSNTGDQSGGGSPASTQTSSGPQTTTSGASSTSAPESQTTKNESTSQSGGEGGSGSTPTPQEKKVTF